MIAFSAPLPPCAKPRPRFGRGRVFMPPAYRTWQRAFRACMPRVRAVLRGRIAVSVVFATPTGRMRPDLDNAAGAVLDALQPDVIGNDRDVVVLLAKVVRARRATIAVAIDLLEAANDGEVLCAA